MRSRFFSLLIVMLLAALLLSTVAAQSSAPPQTAPRIEHPIPGQDTTPEEDRIRREQEKEMAKKANAERQAQLKRDTDKLLQLATELKEYVDKTNENILSMNVIKKSDEIEKLAHSVKEKMKASY